MTRTVRIRAAHRDDVGMLLTLIAELAAYERASERALGTEELLGAALFGPEPCAEALIAELADEQAPRPDAVAGFALFYRSFSTWECRPGIWLEDLYVKPEHRRAGVGRLLLLRLAQIAHGRGYARLEWAALEWNTPALQFYDKLGAELLVEWRMLRLDGAALDRAASQPTPAR